jgi:nicotinamide-nucleotide amidase
VPAPLIVAVGAVSREVAEAMAEGAIAKSAAHIAVAVTGVAGPGGGSAEKPVGLVWFGLAKRGHSVIARSAVFPGDRAAIRAATVEQAFALIRGAVTR